MTRIPKGCDQQGRHPEALDDEPPRHDMFDVVIRDACVALAVIGAVIAAGILIMRLVSA